ncbi:DUF5753 domain-containing protein [Amycolatopsis keratiniphila]|uniref:DUF5753 domain-containing protein n=1 Tax=Amycolatopsis keratiniphila TaxID=129921 RepID=UPI001E563884|nr:DUF5753 domain-containing protein [Amycolatopsis keratiniphila]
MLDTESTSITTYDPVEVPRHLQVETYIRNSRGYDHCHDLDTILRTRLHSQQSSFRHPRSFTFYIPETVLGGQIGCPTVAHAQLSHLLIASSLPHCRIHLVPTGAGLADIRTAFTLYQHDDHRPVIHCQLPSISLFLENDHDIAFFESYLERITRPALSRQETRDWLTGRLAKLEATPG